MTKLLFTLLLLIYFFNINYSKECSKNYECNLPYSYCGNGWLIDARSIGLGRDGRIYFTARNQFDNSNNQLGPSFLVSVIKDSTNGNPGTSIVYKIIDEQPNGPVFNRVNGIGGINQLSNGKFLIIKDMYRYLPLYGTIEKTTQKFTTAFKQNFENSIYIDGDTMYRCIDNRLESVTPVSLSLDSTISSTKILYNNTNYCNGLVKVGSNLIFTQRIQIGDQSIIGFYITVANCNNCSTPSPMFSVTDPAVYSIAADKDYFFYSTRNGLFRVPMNGDISKRIKLSDNPNIKGILRDQTSSGLYYASSFVNGSSIVRIDTIDYRITTLYDYVGASNPLTEKGTCQCLSAFTGNDCNNCNGTINWEFDPIANNNYPVCHPFLPDGSVSYCSQDWQCTNNPYNYCFDNSCVCRKGFGGNICQYCSSNNVTWSSDGIPTCNLYYHGYTTSN
ncbi:hypothetical protein RB653_003900 [Dictyostelium firmibasis]|uniref:EGF-like domain-containing protein n=1 Tax=Dictyostelium firmibasis TaxID=79012 RepID=A0AAN7TZZ4_9MYCE